MACLVIATAAAGTYIGVRVGAADDAAREPALLVEDRDKLSVCVAGVAGLAVSEEDVQVVRAALDQGLSAHSALPAEYVRREVTAGCPEPSASLGEPIRARDIRGSTVDKPSEHRLFVYLVPDSAYRETFGSMPFVSAPEEYLCRLDDCSEVSIGVYIAASARGGELTDALLDGLYLSPRASRPDPTIDWERCAKPHRIYGCDHY